MANLPFGELIAVRLDHSLFIEPRTTTTGITSVSKTVDLKKNSLVRCFEVVVRAARADRTTADTVGQVRAYSAGGNNSVVVDFGVPRTVSSVSIKDGTISSVKSWVGAAFGEKSLSAQHDLPLIAFDGEVRTERLLITASKAIHGADITLVLPEPPSDLEIRINGGPPVWTHPGPVQLPPGATAAPSAGAWSTNHERIVDLTEAFKALLGDPLADAVGHYEIKLTTKVPGVLDIVPRDETQSLAYVNRIRFAGDPSTTLDFRQEGIVDVPLALPPAAASGTIESIGFNATANLPPERTLPAAGPDAAMVSARTPVAELVLDPEHAACARLGVVNAGHEQLGELTAIKAPLTVTGDGAEARVVLWSGSADAPQEPLPGGTSKPVSIAATPPGEDVWTRFELPRPVPLDPAKTLWAAIVVSRGSAAWALGRKGLRSTSTPDDAVADANAVLRGAPNGPWLPLPPPFLKDHPFEARARIRVAGNGSKASPVSPLAVNAGADWQPVTPTPKGVAASVTSGKAIAPNGNPTLRMLSRTPGAVTLRDIDVIWHQ